MAIFSTGPSGSGFDLTFGIDIPPVHEAADGDQYVQTNDGLATGQWLTRWQYDEETEAWFELTDTQNIPVALAATLGLEQKLLAKQGQVGLTVLVASLTTTGKVQGVSLGDGNVVEVYADGASYTRGDILYREFMSMGEPICFTGLSFGAVITATQGFYGLTEISGVSNSTNDQGVMPLMSFGLAFKSTFLYAFRNATGANNDRGIIYVANGPLDNTIRLTDSVGNVVRGQTGITLRPWQVTFLDTDGNQEYILSGTQLMMASMSGRGGGKAIDGTIRPLDNLTSDSFLKGRQFDCRLVLPLASDMIGNPKSGFMSTPYEDVAVDSYRRNGATTNFTVSSGSPVSVGAYGGNLINHNPAGYVRFRATGLVTCYSGADGQGGDSLQFADVSTLSQVVAQPFKLYDTGGVASEVGLTIFSPYEGSADIFEWDFTTNSLTLAYSVNLTRGTGGSVSSQNDQLYPAAASVSNGNSNNTVLRGDLNPGVIIANVPIGVVTQTANGRVTMRSQNSTTTTSIYTQRDETVSYGWTPNERRAEIVLGEDNVLYRRSVSSGSETWEVC